MGKIREVKEKLTEIHKLAAEISNMIPNIKEEKEVITYTVGDTFKDTFNTICMLVQSHAQTVVLINLENGNRYYDVNYMPNVNDPYKLTQEEFNAICNNTKEDCWIKVDNPLLGDK